MLNGLSHPGAPGMGAFLIQRSRDQGCDCLPSSLCFVTWKEVLVESLLPRGAVLVAVAVRSGGGRTLRVTGADCAWMRCSSTARVTLCQEVCASVLCAERRVRVPVKVSFQVGGEGMALCAAHCVPHAMHILSHWTLRGALPLLMREGTDAQVCEVVTSVK